MGPKMGRERLARYSLTVLQNQAAVDAGLAWQPLVPQRGPAQADEGADEALRLPGRPGHRDLDRLATTGSGTSVCW